ncbi:Gag-Pol polyprotein [Labeo rohita]|uniref:Gag-Pol polyprotein n=1 Tax=Labeo rohita TaxID=84645 RepID=A0ABQ8LC19_LABRO|nr:Gag-Pol polyprotein [Labeo rohita]
MTFNFPTSCSKPGEHGSKSYQTFSASPSPERAYGSVAYIQTISPQGDQEIAFLTARSRVSPKKQQSIPRLELCVTLTGAQLAKLLKSELSVPIRQVTLWSDSTTVLAWIQADSCRFKVFVGTRVAEIWELTDPKDWRYVDSKSNPADDTTRGKTLAKLAKPSRWSQGPSFLLLPPDQWPQSPFLSLPTEDAELKHVTFCGLTVPVTNRTLPDWNQFGSYKELLAATARILHGAATPTEVLTTEDYREAELALLLIHKAKYDSTTHLIRVGGRLRQTEQLDESTIHPIVLDPKHPISRLIIQDFDESLHHPGAERVFAEVRRKYWRGREAIRQHQRTCLGCKQWRGQPSIPRMADLPPSRLCLLQPAFYSTGLDCFGPYLIKIGRRHEKRWGIIFKCLTTRAVYLDLLHQMDTDSFLMALRRFITRKGKPFEIISDQGTNFRGGERALQEDFAALHPSLQEQSASHQISFKFNPPGASHFGGCWEREIRSLKSALCSILGDQIVTEEVLRTVLVEIEGILNSKPLGYTFSDIADPDSVTPNMLLMGRPDSSLLQVIYTESEMLSKRRWRHSQLLADQFWRRFLPKLKDCKTSTSFKPLNFTSSLTGRLMSAQFPPASTLVYRTGPDIQ